MGVGLHGPPVHVREDDLGVVFGLVVCLGSGVEVHGCPSVCESDFHEPSLSFWVASVPLFKYHKNRFLSILKSPP